MLYICQHDVNGNPVVTNCHGEPLDPRLDVINHSPCGFYWGYYGQGPTQLALALLCDYFGNDNIELAKKYHCEFRNAVVSKQHMDSNWSITTQGIEDALVDIMFKGAGELDFIKKK